MKTQIFKDIFYLECIRLAQQSKGNERYGSILVKDGEIIGKGFNRAIAHSSFGKLERKIKQGMANHAEIEALNDSLDNSKNVDGSDLYVAGYFPENNQLFFKKYYTCVKCLSHFKNYKIASIYVPTPEGWIKKDLEEATEEAQEFKQNTHKKRLKVILGNFFLSDI
jgi:deoxycytidylate deaminase